MWGENEADDLQISGMHFCGAWAPILNIAIYTKLTLAQLSP